MSAKKDGNQLQSDVLSAPELRLLKKLLEHHNYYVMFCSLDASDGDALDRLLQLRFADIREVMVEGFPGRKKQAPLLVRSYALTNKGRMYLRSLQSDGSIKHLVASYASAEAIKKLERAAAAREPSA